MDPKDDYVLPATMAEAIAQLSELAVELHPGAQEFAESLIRHYARYGTLSERQMVCVLNMIEESNLPVPQPTSPVDMLAHALVLVEEAKEAFERAKAQAKQNRLKAKAAAKAAQATQANAADIRKWLDEHGGRWLRAPNGHLLEVTFSMVLEHWPVGRKWLDRVLEWERVPRVMAAVAEGRLTWMDAEEARRTVAERPVTPSEPHA